MATYDYPDFSNAIPDNPELRYVSRLRDGHTEQRFRETVQDIIRECGNRLIARGIAVELVKEETEKPR
jgi:transposase